MRIAEAVEEHTRIEEALEGHTRLEGEKQVGIVRNRFGVGQRVEQKEDWQHLE